MVKKKKAVITEKHYVTPAQVSSAQNTLTAYGKLVKGSEVPPSSAGISHPHGLNEPLQASLVFGLAVGGRCITLPSPEQVVLPAPDGPADGCGWDPTEYVMWKNLPKDWITLHIHAETGTLSDALLPGLPKGTRKTALRGAVAEPTGIQDRVVSVVKLWAQLPSDPDDNEQLELIWDNSPSGKSVPFPDATRRLVELLQDEFKNPPTRTIRVQSSDIAPPGRINTVDDLAKAVSQT